MLDEHRGIKSWFVSRDLRAEMVEVVDTSRQS